MNSLRNSVTYYIFLLSLKAFITQVFFVISLLTLKLSQSIFRKTAPIEIL